MMYDSRELKAARVRQGKTQVDIAKALGITEVAYNRKENGRSLFSLVDIQKLAEAINLEDSQIISIFFNRKLNPNTR